MDLECFLKIAVRLFEEEGLHDITSELLLKWIDVFNELKKEGRL